MKMNFSRRAAKSQPSLVGTRSTSPLCGHLQCCSNSSLECFSKRSGTRWNASLPGLAIAWSTFGLAAAVILAGCAKNPAEGKTAAEVKEPSSNAVAEPAPQSSARTYTITEDSTIGFFASKVTGSHNGGFKKFSGEFALADGSITGSGHKVVIEMDSTWADNPRLTGHLKSPDFFNAAVFPQATFELTSSEKIAGSKVKLTGNLTLHGVTKQISFPAELTADGVRAALKAEFFIKRFDFTIKYPGKANDLIRDEVVIKLDVKAMAKA